MCNQLSQGALTRLGQATFDPLSRISLFHFCAIPLCAHLQQVDPLPALCKWAMTHEARTRGDLAAPEVGSRSGPDAENQRVNTRCTLLGLMLTRAGEGYAHPRREYKSAFHLFCAPRWKRHSFRFCPRPFCLDPVAGLQSNPFLSHG